VAASDSGIRARFDLFERRCVQVQAEDVDGLFNALFFSMNA